MASKVNVGNRTPAQDAAAKAALANDVEAQGARIVEENGAVYSVTESFGLTVKTRIG